MRIVPEDGVEIHLLSGIFEFLFLNISSYY